MIEVTIPLDFDLVWDFVLLIAIIWTAYHEMKHQEHKKILGAVTKMHPKASVKRLRHRLP